MRKVFKIVLMEELNCQLMVGESPRKLAHVCHTTVDVANNTVHAFRTALQSQGIFYTETDACDVFADEFCFDYESEPAGVPEIVRPIKIVANEEVFFEKTKVIEAAPEVIEPVTEEVFEETPKDIRKRGFSKK